MKATILRQLAQALERAELRQRQVPVNEVKTDMFSDLRAAVDFAVALRRFAVPAPLARLRGDLRAARALVFAAGPPAAAARLRAGVPPAAVNSVS